jgi:hypothetical protein
MSEQEPAPGADAMEEQGGPPAAAWEGAAAGEPLEAVPPPAEAAAGGTARDAAGGGAARDAAGGAAARDAAGGAAESAAATPRRRWFLALYVLPVVLALGWIALPLARGTETLYMRDVLNAHLAMKWAEMRALRQGYFPLIDIYRGGGQPLAGNPNAVPFYPTNLLFLWAGPFWALDAHFWLHLLLAPFACFWMARRWGLSREAAWAAAVCYAASGFYLSHLSFYNLIAGATLAPALVAACLGFAAPRVGNGALGRPALARRALYLAAAAALWALLLLGGDPLQAALGFGLAATALLFVRRDRMDWRAWLALAGAFACGTLIALPQIVEFRRILPVSFRGYRGYTEDVATIASWDPRQAAEWLLPTLFGRLDVRILGAFWGRPYFTGAPPLYPSLYPGLLALALVAAAGRPRRRAAWWAWCVAAGGIFFSLGRFNPAIEWLLARQGAGELRYPVKFWMPVAVGAALLCGLGFEALLRPAAAAPAGGMTALPAPGVPRSGATRRFRWALGGLALVLGAAWLGLSALPGPAARLLRRIIPADRTMLFVQHERLRWAGLCLFSLLILAAFALLSRWLLRPSRRAAWVAGGLLLAAHAATQVWLLRPLYPTDAVAPYRVPPPALAYLPAGVTVVDPDFEHQFGNPTFGTGRFPSEALLWLERRAFYEMFPFTGAQWDRRYELTASPEGLDTYLTRLTQGSLSGADDEQRVRMLAAWGVGRLLIERQLAPLPSHARLLAVLPSFGQQLHVYEVVDRAPQVFLARRIWRAPNMTVASQMLKNAAFDPRQDAVMPGAGPALLPAGGGLVRVLREGPESLDLDLDVGAGGSLLVVQRAQLIYSATLDGKPVPLVPANLHRNGLLAPAGHHRVRMWIERRGFHRAVAVSALVLAALLAIAGWALAVLWRAGGPGGAGGRYRGLVPPSADEAWRR